MGFETVHETVVSDVLDILKDGIHTASDLMNKPGDVGRARSLTKYTKGLILVFPVAASKSNHIESIGIVAKAIEQKAVTLLQLAFSAANITTVKSGVEYLNQFHTNLDFDKMSLDSFMDIMDSMIDESTVSADVYSQYRTVSDDLRNLSYTLNTGINESFSLNQYSIIKPEYARDEYTVLKEADYDQYAQISRDTRKAYDDLLRNNGMDMEDIYKGALYRNSNDPVAAMKDVLDIISPINSNMIKDIDVMLKAANMAEKDAQFQKMYDQNKEKNDAEIRNLKDRLKIDQRKTDLDAERLLHQKKKDRDDAAYRDKRDEIMDAERERQARLDLMRNNLVSNDVRKANELVPTMMIVNFKVIDDEVGEINRQMVIGVKAKIYEIEPSDMINKVITKHTDSDVLLKLVKVGTREISFVKDFLLAINDAKLDALSKSRRGSSNKLFKVLERRSLKGKIGRTLKTKNYYKAITTIVISQEEAEELLKNNVNVSDVKTIRAIMEKLNIMCFVIIDESAEAARFIFDTGDDTYETIPFTQLEREQKDGMSRKVINLIAKMNR